MEWKKQSAGSDAPGRECWVATDPRRGSRDNRYVISHPAGGDTVDYIAVFEAMHACSEAAVCFDFRQDVSPQPFSTLEAAQEACQWHAERGDWPAGEETGP